MSWLCRTILIPLCLTSSVAWAEASSDVAWRVGFSGGYALVGNDLDLGSVRKVGYTLEAGPILSLRFGVDIADVWGIELEVGTLFSAIESTNEGQLLLSALAKAQWRPLVKQFQVTPLVSVGAGLLSSLGKPSGQDSDLLLQVGAGVQWRALPQLDLRLEAQVWLSDGIDGAVAMVPLVSLGLDWRFGGGGQASEPAPPKSTSIETPHVPVAPPVDLRCPPDVPKSACVDSDGDDILDAFDECPLEKGPPPRGCPL